jgi:hypothetical protein
MWGLGPVASSEPTVADHVVERLLRLMTRIEQEQAVDIGPYLELERAGVWSLGRAQPLPPPGDSPTSPSAA